MKYAARKAGPRSDHVDDELLLLEHLVDQVR